MSFKYSTLEYIGSTVSGYITKNFEVLRVVRHVEYPVDGVVEHHGLVFVPVSFLEGKSWVTLYAIIYLLVWVASLN